MRLKKVDSEKTSDAAAHPGASHSATSSDWADLCPSPFEDLLPADNRFPEGLTGSELSMSPRCCPWGKMSFAAARRPPYSAPSGPDRKRPT
ncbi:hypothetical protein HF521_017711 [Silurus meridionalis]|uniref:Uncharacterized protein n=1 Tax=Silurus meridionalis TaxID=175797 RepID=A0A8T0BNR6_SILME|nr:hypothetical protein HF521_017711 [Silurus meridionalis]